MIPQILFGRDVILLFSADTQLDNEIAEKYHINTHINTWVEVFF